MRTSVCLTLITLLFDKYMTNVFKHNILYDEHAWLVMFAYEQLDIIHDISDINHAFETEVIIVPLYSQYGVMWIDVRVVFVAVDVPYHHPYCMPRLRILWNVYIWMSRRYELFCPDPGPLSSSCLPSHLILCYPLFCSKGPFLSSPLTLKWNTVSNFLQKRPS